VNSKYHTLLAGFLWRRLEGCHDCLVKDILQLVLRESRAFDVFDSSQVLSHSLSVFLPNRGHLLLGEFLANGRILSQIGLCSNNQTGDARAVVVDFREPFLAHVLKRGRRGDGKADQEDVCLGV
jgi:hypothetical protein